MPRIRQYNNKYANEDFIKVIKKAQIDADITKLKQLAELVDIPYATFWRRIKDPDTLTVEQLRRIIKVLPIPPEAVLAFLGYK